MSQATLLENALVIDGNGSLPFTAAVLIEADQIVAALRERNHPVEYLLFADEGHGVVKLTNRVKSFTAGAAFLDRYVRNRK